MKKLNTCTLSAGGLALLLLSAAPAQAQTETSPPSEAPPATPVARASSSSSSGDGAGLGVGANAWLSGLTGAEVVYDTSMWHIGGTLGFASASNGAGGVRNTTISIGGSGWYHISKGTNADFSLGGGIGFLDLTGGGNSVQAFVVEPGAMARVFLTPNVALSARVGLAMVFGDNTPVLGTSSSVGLSGQTTAAFGFTYFFR